MTDRSVEHATFAIERTYDASPERVLAAWGEPAAKARWFGDSDGEFELDFRVGGPQREQGTGSLLDALGAELREPANR